MVSGFVLFPGLRSAASPGVPGARSRLGLLPRSGVGTYTLRPRRPDDLVRTTFGLRVWGHAEGVLGLSFLVRPPFQDGRWVPQNRGRDLESQAQYAYV